MAGLRPTGRPSKCHKCGGRVRLNGDQWWCYVCDRVVPARRARKSMSRRASPEKREATRIRSFGTADRIAWLHSLPCCAAGRPGHCCGPWDMDQGRVQVQAVHVRARGMGAAKGGADDQVPGCWVMHEDAGEFRTTKRARWEAQTGLDLVLDAARYTALWSDQAETEEHHTTWPLFVEKPEEGGH